ncbi:MAG: hypothetical protein RMK65_12410 [Anaerolineae bacterium]|nr:hypothetical protein [Anaerolineae bacterium]
MSTHRWPGVFLVVALLLQSALPALAAPVPSRAAPSAALFPPWYRIAQADSLQTGPAAYAQTEVSLLGPAASVGLRRRGLPCRRRPIPDAGCERSAATKRPGRLISNQRSSAAM